MSLHHFYISRPGIGAEQFVCDVSDDVRDRYKALPSDSDDFGFLAKELNDPRFEGPEGKTMVMRPWLSAS